MRAPATVDEFVELACRSGLVEPGLAATLTESPTGQTRASSPRDLASELIQRGVLTRFQADSLLLGKWRGFIISGKYRLFQKLGSGGMGSVYLCEHMRMRRRVALKVLQLVMADDPAAVERFNLEARAAAALDHPNIVRAHDVDNDGKLHFIVLEYVDGNNLHDLVRKHGPLSPLRAANYIRQAAQGLDHAHAAGLVHRDLKPGNLLLDRSGAVKLLDMGLARFFHEDMNPLLWNQEVGNTLGTAEYVAPEQVEDSLVDIRADIYSLGCTFYFLLSGNSPFPQAKTMQEKLTFQQVRRPKPIRALRPEVPEELAKILEKMMAKDVRERYQTPAEVVQALAAWTQAPIAPPSEEEMPPRSPAERCCSMPGSRVSPAPGSSRAGPSTPKDAVAPTTPANRAPLVQPPVQPPPAPVNASSADTLRGVAVASKVTRTDWPKVVARGSETAPAASAAPSPAAAPAPISKTPPAAGPRGKSASEPLSGSPKPAQPAAANGRIVKATKPALESSRSRSSVAVSADVADEDEGDRWAGRILWLGATLFTIAILVLFWWLLRG